MQHSAATLVAAARASAANLPLSEADRWLLSLPYAHIGGLSVLIRCLLAKVPVIVDSGSFSDADFLRRIDAEGASLYSLVPTQLYDLVSALTDGDRKQWALRWILVGGAPTPLRLREAARRIGLRVLFTYGLTEAGSQVCTQRPGDIDLPVEEADVGYPLPQMQLRLNGEQRVQIRGPNLMLGYVGEPKSRDEEGWFTTSDRGRFTERGSLCLLGRSDHLIISGGENVDPQWVEQILLGCHGLLEVAVLGIPHPRWGQEVVALVALEAGPADEVLARLEEHARTQLPRFAAPKRYIVVPALPKIGIGKLDRAALPHLFQTAQDAGRAQER